MMSSASELISFRVRPAVLEANNAMTNQKEILEKILAPLAEEGIEISGIDLDAMKLDHTVDQPDRLAQLNRPTMVSGTISVSAWTRIRRTL